LLHLYPGVGALAAARPRRLPVEFWVLAGLAVIADVRPFAARGPLRRFAAIFVSISFTFSIMLVWGAWPAIVVQTLAIIGGAVRLHWGVERTLILVLRFGLAFLAAEAILRLPGAPSFAIGQHISGSDALYLLASAGTWFTVNYGVFALWLLLRERRSTRRTLTATLRYELLSSGALLMLAPLIVGAPTGWSLLLAIVPVFAINQIAWLYNQQDEQLRHDPLTGLLSRPAIVSEVGEMVAPRDRRGPRDVSDGFALLLIDLDRFKQVNDALGHAAGDRLLAIVAQRLATAGGRTGPVARLGGDEFAVIARGVDASGALEVAEELSQVLATPAHLDDQPLDVSGSIGVAVYPDDGRDYMTLMQHADVAMYEAKHRANGIARYTAEHDHNSPARLGLLADLRSALEDPSHRDEITFHYQPQIRIRTGDVVGVEALLRWRHPTRGPVDIEEVLHAAEHSPVIRLLTRRVVDDVVAQLARWNDGGLRLRASINVSVRDLDTDDLVSHLSDSLARNHIRPDQISVEITETALLGDPGPAEAALRQIANLGVAVSLDDFGTGYSSLAHLRRLPVSEVKVDRSFVGRMAKDAEDRAIVQSIIDLAHALGLAVVAEGVEDGETAQMLADAGCEVAQGWLYARAMPAEALVTWLATRSA
jgi:diguanylate cyclase